MMEICNRSQCTGCSACVGVCNRHAISMKLSEEGFYYPEIDFSKCVNCGLCIKSCPNNTKVSKLQTIPYLSWNLNSRIRENSSSGGVFSAIAYNIINKNGVVCGAAYDKDMTVRHIVVDNIRDLEKLRGSKYAQSVIGDVYIQIMQILKEDRWVYFVGTPCQVAGLKNLIRKSYNKLLTSDIICHGVPSGELLKEQIKCFEKRVKSSIIDFNFRDKHRMGQTPDISILYSSKNNASKKKYYNFETVPYCYGFRKNIIIRESCFNCIYTSVSRVGDISLGDFWNVKKMFPKVKRSPGCSLILVSFGLGMKIVEELRSEINLQETTIDIAVSKQAQLKAPAKRPNERSLYKSYKDFGLYQKTILKPSLKYMLRKHIVNLIKILTFFKYRY